MPVDYKRYPSNWKSEIRPRILARAQNRCEKCGVQNHIEIVRSTENPEWYIVFDPDELGYLDPWNGEPIRLSEIPDGCEHLKHVKVVLTIAHMDHDVGNNADDNLKALCQRCHLVHDAKHHAKNARETRRKKRADEALQRDAEIGQTRMF